MKVIKIENVNKSYRLGVYGSQTFSHELKEWWLRLKRGMATTKKQPYYEQENDSNYFWALKNINIDVTQGEIIGLIGKNGAGKSTLLKILSRVTAPTSGKIKIKGRIASLLEVGTGFHPELTGRDNIFQNGAILGMSKSEIKSKFDEIVNFSGVEKFIDSPVKRYSSGMYVRLAFAVAAHLDPEILIIDEVLAVGDSEFQKKCLGKMNDVAKEGRTIVFVSHNMTAIRALCNRGILLKNGVLHYEGNVEQAISIYEDTIWNNKFSDASSINDSNHRRGLGHIRFSSIKIKNSNGQETNNFQFGEDIIIEGRYVVNEDVQNAYAGIGFRSNLNQVYIGSTKIFKIGSELFKGQQGEFKFILHSSNILPNTYPLYFWIGNYNASLAYDVVDGLIAPITIYSNKIIEAIGMLPTEHVGYFIFDSDFVNTYLE